MDIRPAGAPVDDPFWGAVRRRHPDVDLVLLPAEEPGLPGPEDAPGPDSWVADEAVERALTDTDRAAAGLWPLVAPVSQVRPQTMLRAGRAPGTVRPVARVVDHRSDGYAVLVSLRHELESAGWLVDRPRTGGLERLVGERDEGTTLRASYAEQTGVLVLELAGADLPVGRDRARSYLRAGS